MANVAAIQIVERIRALCGGLEGIGLEILSWRGAISQCLQRGSRDCILRSMQDLVWQAFVVWLIDSVEERCDDVGVRYVEGGRSGSHAWICKIVDSDWLVLYGVSTGSLV